MTSRITGVAAVALVLSGCATMKGHSGSDSKSLEQVLQTDASSIPLPSAIKDIRHALGLTQDEFAKLFRLTLRQVKELEQGHANPTLETLNRIAKVFGFSLGFVPRQDPKAVMGNDDQRRPVGAGKHRPTSIWVK